jgi:hypothetical protein
VKQKRYHAIGVEHGDRLFEECGDDSGRIYRAARARSGKPVPLGAQLATIAPDEDGEHYLVDVIGLSGPAQVATEAYRSGWVTAFGEMN